MPAQAGIQETVPVEVYLNRRWLLDRPVKPGEG